MTLDLAWQDGGWSGFVPWIEVVHVYDQGSRDRIRLFLLCLNLPVIAITPSSGAQCTEPSHAG